MRLIDADALKFNFVHGRWDDTYISKTDIDAAPTIDPVKHGKWDKISDRNYKCSSCNAWWTDGFMTEAYRQGYDHGYENAKEDVLLQLMDDLNIAEECEKCPRWDGRCKGHLSWLCRKIREAMNDET